MPTPADHLALARTARDGAVLLRLARTPYSFVWQALATNPHTPSAALVELAGARDSPHNDNGLLRLLAERPDAGPVVLRATLAAVAAKLAEGERPYAAVLALAGRPELDPAEVAALGTLPGASARLRRGLARRLADRPPAYRLPGGEHAGTEGNTAEG
ncbi:MULTISPECIES: hypothetical protein [Streptomyces]|uniref:hypothetical protein n=1 Tax=Streptomyces TaxID=1883 RepID=UPI000B333C16|nr:hypothetical protein [Streptomyces sp. T7(2022)]MCG5119795.1 hypothetical protein [Streptomyces sp. T7(2022)]WTC03335.1 hypothetical protein OG794_16650 [Streptomyces albidoflavus]